MIDLIWDRVLSLLAAEKGICPVYEARVKRPDEGAANQLHELLIPSLVALWSFR